METSCFKTALLMRELILHTFTHRHICSPFTLQTFCLLEHNTVHVFSRTRLHQGDGWGKLNLKTKEIEFLRVTRFKSEMAGKLKMWQSYIWERIIRFQRHVFESIWMTVFNDSSKQCGIFHQERRNNWMYITNKKGPLLDRKERRRQL